MAPPSRRRRPKPKKQQNEEPKSTGRTIGPLPAKPSNIDPAILEKYGDLSCKDPHFREMLGLPPPRETTCEVVKEKVGLPPQRDKSCEDSSPAVPPPPPAKSSEVVTGPSNVKRKDKVQLKFTGMADTLESCKKRGLTDFGFCQGGSVVMRQMISQGWFSGMGLGPNNRGMERHFVPGKRPIGMGLGWPVVKDSHGLWQPVEGAVSSFVKFRKATTPSDLELSSTEFVDEEEHAASAPHVDEDVVDPEDLSLEDILKPEFIVPLIETLQLEQLLGPDLPEGQQSAEDILILLQQLPSPFREQMDLFSYALRTGLLDVSSLGLDPSKFNKFTIVSFLEALEDSVANQSESQDKKTRIEEN